MLTHVTNMWSVATNPVSVAWRMCGSAWERKANDVIIPPHPPHPTHPTPPPTHPPALDRSILISASAKEHYYPHPTPPHPCPRTVTCLAQHRSITSVKFSNSYRAASQPIAKNIYWEWQECLVFCVLFFGVHIFPKAQTMEIYGSTHYTQF